jgi:hypothetical protein
MSYTQTRWSQLTSNHGTTTSLPVSAAICDVFFPKLHFHDRQITRHGHICKCSEHSECNILPVDTTGHVNPLPFINYFVDALRGDEELLPFTNCDAYHITVGRFVEQSFVHYIIQVYSRCGLPIVFARYIAPYSTGTSDLAELVQNQCSHVISSIIAGITQYSNLRIPPEPTETVAQPDEDQLDRNSDDLQFVDPQASQYPRRRNRRYPSTCNHFPERQPRRRQSRNVSN